MTPEEIKALMEKIANATKDQIGVLSKEQKDQLAAVKAEIESKMNESLELKNIVKNLEIALSEIKTAMNRSEIPQSVSHLQSAGNDEYKSAFNAYMRKGREIAEEVLKNEFKGMSVQIDEDGGFLVTPQISNEIVKKVFESSPIRELSSVTTISTDALEIYEDLDEADAGWVGETQDRPETDTPKIKMIKIPVHELYAKPKATQKLLDDAAWNVETWLQEKVSDKFARVETTAFIKGDGVLKPLGILSYPETAQDFEFGKLKTITTSVTASFNADDILDLLIDFKEAYLPNVVLLVHRSALKIMRKLKATDGTYLWQPGVNGLTDSTFAGHPVRLAADLEPLAANSKSIIAGDFQQGYQIVDRFGVRVLRDPYTNKPNIVFYSTKRVGGGVKNFEAIKILKTKA